MGSLLIPPNGLDNPAIHVEQPVGLKVKQYAGLVTRRFQQRISARSLFSMARSLAMLGTATPHVELTCFEGLADLERLEGPWLAAGSGERFGSSG